MKPLRIASVQMNALKDDLDHNLDVHVNFIQKAAKKKCHLIMFPELSATAHYGDEKVIQFAEETGKGRVFLRDHMIVADLDPHALDKARRDPGYNLKYRRPEMYSELTRMI
jgi:predicted amidohydrolase